MVRRERQREGPSEFFAELAAWGTDSGEATVTVAAGDPAEDEQNPMLGQRLNLVRDWPGPARPDDTDALFTSGWRAAAVEAVAEGAVQAALVDSLEGEDRGTFERAAAERRQLASHLRDREAVEGGPGIERVPQTVGASAVITYAQCPKRFYWSSVRPLPRFSGPAARIGTEIHAWIERRAVARVSCWRWTTGPTSPTRSWRATRDGWSVSATPSRTAGSPMSRRCSPSARSCCGWATRPSAGASTPIFGTVDGPWEVVDWKTGRKPSSADPTAGLQLDIYGLAAVEIWGKAAADVTLTYFYLASGEEVTRPMDDPDVVRQRVLASLDAIAAGEFDPTPGSMVPALRFPKLLRRGEGVARGPAVS